MAHSTGMLDKLTPSKVVGHGCDVEATAGISENASNARMVSEHQKGGHAHCNGHQHATLCSGRGETLP